MGVACSYTIAHNKNIYAITNDMTIKQSIEVLKCANRWRRGADIEMPDPKEFGEAIDVAIEVMEQFLKDTPAMKRCHIKPKRNG